MREILIDTIIQTVERLCVNSNYYLNDDVLKAIKHGVLVEESPVGKDVLEKLIENAHIASNKNMAICQDTGMAVVFLEIGQEVCIKGGSLYDAINEGVRRGYQKGYLRKSVVSDPILRVNTKDNTPAIIHCDIVEGDSIKITVAPKGFGSENMSALKMLTPSDGIEGVKNFIIETIIKAGPNPCPPIIVGVGIGGTMEKCAIMAKRALLRQVGKRNDKEHIRKLEEEVLTEINNSGIGPSGLGGRVTALAINIDVFPTHIAGLPVAVNLSCHATRHAEEII